MVRVETSILVDLPKGVKYDDVMAIAIQAVAAGRYVIGTAYTATVPNYRKNGGTRQVVWSVKQSITPDETEGELYRLFCDSQEELGWRHRETQHSLRSGRSAGRGVNLQHAYNKQHDPK